MVSERERNEENYSFFICDGCRVLRALSIRNVREIRRTNAESAFWPVLRERNATKSSWKGNKRQRQKERLYNTYSGVESREKKSDYWEPKARSALRGYLSESSGFFVSFLLFVVFFFRAYAMRLLFFFFSNNRYLSIPFIYTHLLRTRAV